jgi:uncharacterized delta-60 repeat protein
MRAASQGLWSALIWSVCAAGCGTVTTGDPDAGVVSDGGADASPLTDAAPGTVALAAPAMTFVRTGVATPIAVEIARGDGVSGPVEVVVAEPPTGVTFEPLVIPADETTGALRATVAGDAAFRVETLTLRAAAGDASGTAEAGLEIIGARGTANPGFGKDGTVTLASSVASGYVIDVVAQGERSVVVTYSGPRIYAARVDISGALDPTFAGSGHASIDLAPIGVNNVTWAGLSVDGMGRIVIGGTAEVNAGTSPFVVRLTADGNVDPAVTPRLVSVSEDDPSMSAVAAHEDGRITLMGIGRINGEPRNWGVRLRADGAILGSDTPDALPGGLRAVVQADGLIVGQDGYDVVRVRPNGTLDPSFGSNGRSVLPNAEGPAQWTLVQRIGDGFVIVGYSAAWRLGGDGRVDTTFGELGKATLPAFGLDSGMNAFDLGDGHTLIHIAGIPVRGMDYYVGFVEIDGTGALAPATGGDGSVTDVVGWFGYHSAALARRRVVIAGDSQTRGSAVRLRQYWY